MAGHADEADRQRNASKWSFFDALLPDRLHVMPQGNFERPEQLQAAASVSCVEKMGRCCFVIGRAEFRMPPAF